MKRQAIIIRFITIFLISCVTGGFCIRVGYAAADNRQEKKLDQAREDTEKISLQQKELKAELFALGFSFSKFEKGHEALKQENRKLAQDVAFLKKTMPPAPDGRKNGPQKTPEYYEQGEQFLKEGDFMKAIESFEKSLRIKPRNAEAHYRLGFLYQHALDDERKAIYHLKRFMSLSPDPERKAEARYLLRMLTNDADRTY